MRRNLGIFFVLAAHVCGVGTGGKESGRIGGGRGTGGGREKGGKREFKEGGMRESNAKRYLFLYFNDFHFMIPTNSGLISGNAYLSGYQSTRHCMSELLRSSSLKEDVRNKFDVKMD